MPTSEQAVVARGTSRPIIAWLAVALVIATVAMLWPFAPAILFAIWASALACPSQRRLAARLGGRPHVAAMIITTALVAVVAPLFIIIASLAGDAVELVHRVAQSDRVADLLRRFPAQHAPSDLATRAYDLGRGLAGSAAKTVLGLVIAIGGLYVMLADGDAWLMWLEQHAPVSRDEFRRLFGAFVETGRGLFYGILGAGAVQAVVATILYLALGVPQALPLGVLTLVCSILPAVGTAIVWAPVAVALVLTGRVTAGVIMAAAGVLLIGSIDNVVRPLLARKGRLQLPGTVVAIAMFGGVATLGARGVLIGPLVVRLAKEALEIWHPRCSSSGA